MLQIMLFLMIFHVPSPLLFKITTKKIYYNASGTSSISRAVSEKPKFSGEE